MSAPKIDRKPRIGLKDIAGKAGVSISTVSHVMNGTARISEEVRARVMRNAQELGYLGFHRDRATKGALKRLLLAVPSYGLAETEANLFLWTVLSSLRAYCAEREIQLVPFSPLSEVLTGATLVEAALRENADGIMLMHDDRPELLSALANLRHKAPPMVLVNGEDAEMTVDTVSPQNRFAARQAVKWLTDLGHRNILHVSWNGRTTIHRRRDGYLDAMRDIGVSSESAPILAFPEWDLHLAQQILSEQLVDHVRRHNITAIFCAADNVALHAHRILHQAGLRVPDDISLIGFDDIMQTEMSSPPLSTVHVPMDVMGPMALRVLEDRLYEADSLHAPRRRIELGCRLVKRESVAPPR